MASPCQHRNNIYNVRRLVCHAANENSIKSKFMTQLADFILFIKILTHRNPGDQTFM
jgi:hypothetical protein